MFCGGWGRGGHSRRGKPCGWPVQTNLRSERNFHKSIKLLVEERMVGRE